MKISVFTPTHNPGYLRDAYASLCAQHFSNWEWLLVPNGNDAALASLPKDIVDDARVVIVVAPSEITALGVGALKRFACERASGDVFVELDHDDALAPECLQMIASAVETADAEFIYSDFAVVQNDGELIAYEPTHGWLTYEATVYGKRYAALRSFAPTPESLISIYYAPNHVRAWTREAYWRAGGHDAAFAVGDDHDLISRTYLSGARFHQIKQCLYLYRMHGEGNTYSTRTDEIKAMSDRVGERDGAALVAEWCRRRELPMLDMGAAHNATKGYLSVDLQDADVNCDVRHGLPFADASVGCIRAYDFLEHIPHCTDSTCTHGNDGKTAKCVVGVMNEFYRVLAPGGWLMTRTPSTDGRGAFQDPTHVSFWNPNSFWYYTRSEQARFVRGLECKFQAQRVWQSYPTAWQEAHRILYVYANLVALKGQRVAGPVSI
jgi:O-antigen biosynthesis protein